MKVSKELLKGSTDLLVLTLIEKEPMYGYQMIKELRKKSENVFNLIYIIYNPLCLWKKNQNLGRDILMPHQILENKK